MIRDTFFLSSFYLALGKCMFQSGPTCIIHQEQLSIWSDQKELKIVGSLLKWVTQLTEL